MHSSISSSEHSVPDLPWRRVIGGAMLGLIVIISGMEIRLAQLGYQPAIQDSAEKWARERERVDRLGNQALILIGASRIQLGVDLDTLRQRTGLEPVQLAVDGSSFVPVLENLANDPAVQGTILIDYAPHVLEGAQNGNYGPVVSYLAAYERQRRSSPYTSARSEQMLSDFIHENLRSYADGANPLKSLTLRILPGRPAGNYLMTKPDRSRLADYRRVPMPAFYYQRVIRHLGSEGAGINFAADHLLQTLRQKIDSLRPHGNTAYLKGAKYVGQMARMIEARGGRVIFIATPTSGMIREIDERRYPRLSFLNVLSQQSGIPVFDIQESYATKSFSCPDGSHLDFRDRQAFTTALVSTLWPAKPEQ